MASRELGGLECHTGKCGQRGHTNREGLYRRPEKNERECGGREGRPPGKIRREKRWWGRLGVWVLCPGSKKGDTEWEGVIWLTFSPCYAESPAECQQSQGEQPPGRRHLVIQLWRTGGPLGWVQVWARCGLLTVLESCVPPLLEAGLDPCHQLLGILLSGILPPPGLWKEVSAYGTRPTW